MLQTPLTIQRLYDDNRDSLQLGWFAGFPGGERLISGDVASAAEMGCVVKLLAICERVPSVTGVSDAKLFFRWRPSGGRPALYSCFQFNLPDFKSRQ